MNNRDLTGALFTNDNRNQDNHPWYKGSATIHGEEFWMDAWINEDKNGKKYLSVKFKPKNTQRLETFSDLSDDVPF